MTSNIEWTRETVNPVTGCTKISSGCARCYAEIMSHRLGAMARSSTTGAHSQYLGVTDKKGQWTGAVKFHPKALKKFKKKRPTVFFVGSMSDLFQEKVKRDWLVSIFHAMKQNPQHRYLLLTKRPKEMLEFLPLVPPIPSVFLGASICNEKELSHLQWLKVIRELKWDSSWKTFASFEPWLSPEFSAECPALRAALDWGIIGGESGQDPRPFHQSALEQAIAVFAESKIPLFVKQLGGNGPIKTPKDKKGGDVTLWPAAWQVRQFPIELAQIMGGS